VTWFLGEMAPFDCESTGTDVETARIVSTTVAQIVPGSETLVSSHLIAVDVDIPEAATEVHGITTEYARENGKPAGEVLEAVAAQLAEAMANGIPVVGMNLQFDFTLLDRELRRNELAALDTRLGRPIGPVVDVFVIDKALDKYRKGGRKLVDMCATYGARITDAHDATADALAAARIAYKMGRRTSLDIGGLRDLYGDRPRQAPHIAAAFTMFGRMSLAELHEAQKGWYTEQASSLAAYFRREAHEVEFKAGAVESDPAMAEQLRGEAEELRRRADEVSPDWPMRPWVAS
jgi:DNA polymerase-3 subunit epsilon